MSAPRILVVPTDFSAPSDRGLEVAVEYALLFGSRVELVHVNDAPAYFGFDAIAIPDVEKAMQQRVERALEERAAGVRARGIDCRVGRLEGTAWEAIAAFARRIHADLIVMGTHGRTGIKHAVLGSVAERVIPRSPCPVLVVPPPAPAPPPGDQGA